MATERIRLGTLLAPASRWRDLAEHYEQAGRAERARRLRREAAILASAVET